MEDSLILTEDLANYIVATENSKVVGIFISLLAYDFINLYGLTREQFLNSLNNSLDKLEKSND